MSKKMDATELAYVIVTGVGEVKPGMMLEHPVFGLGKVEAIFKFTKSGEITIRINFEHHGSKALVLEYAKLSKPKSTRKMSFLQRLQKKVVKSWVTYKFQL
ncbi:hypothetical protein [Photobacterium kasasachensis]|uniref:hypothetical protein n=1 Tax=Photobacterium kasasachensis TaxID=2910240 RepID=UPI003D0E2B81